VAFFSFLTSYPHSVIIRNDVTQVMTSEFDINPVLCQFPHMIVQITKISTLLTQYYTNKLNFLYSYGCGIVPQLVHGRQTLIKSRFVGSYVTIGVLWWFRLSRNPVSSNHEECFVREGYMNALCSDTLSLCRRSMLLFYQGFSDRVTRLGIRLGGGGLFCLQPLRYC
jgi:hypothetical protein